MALTEAELVKAVRCDHVVCKRYTKPDKTLGGIIIPESWGIDTTHTLFDVIGVGQTRIARDDDGKIRDAHELFGIEIKRDDIVCAVIGTPIAVPNMRGYFLIWAKNLKWLRRWRHE